ncbi:uncharacterized protein C17orf80 homolog isoform X1 [Falco cherrug]|uniref:uncharacterized protein C17orf80 homolog isoform X1 n=1 Tax=Falco cherrug TaxID=345164 RepID=UPI0024798F91|nr:uncharacterized protein C17orf80 homolog isoform X1 [Falco cherrug]
MAAAPPGRELCPHCRRPFKRLRAHLPHCKAAPSPAPGSAPRPGPSLGPGAGPSTPGGGAGPGAGSGPRAAAAGKSSKRAAGPSVGLPAAAPREAAARKGKAAAAERGGGPGPEPRRQPGGRGAARQADPAVQRGAGCLGLLPEGIKDPPETLRNGLRIVTEKQRAGVTGERSGGTAAGRHCTHCAPAEGPDPGRIQQEGITVAETTHRETHSHGAVENVSASKKGEKGRSLKATKAHVLQDPPETDCRSGPGDLIQQEGTDKTVTEEKQVCQEVDVEHKAPLPALHTKNLHLLLTEQFRGHNEGTSNNYLTSIQKHRERKKQMAVVSEPILNARRDSELALPQFLLHTSKSQPICPSQASGRNVQAGAMGLEWFPDLHPNYDGLSIFPGKPFQEGRRITVKTPKGNFAEGQQGPLSERHLMDVRLGELPMWLATCNFSPQGLLGGVQKAWSSYYNRYINMKRGGPVGISMLLAGYCLLSYGWNYQHIKGHRWRKYH